MKLVLLVMLGLLSACSILPEAAGPTLRYTLESDECTPAALSSKKGTLILRETAASQSINSRRILFKREALTLSSYQLASWVEPPPALFSNLLLKELECRGMFNSVTARAQSVLADYALYTEMLEFYHDLTVQPSVVRVKLRAELTDLNTRRIMATRTFAQSLGVASKDSAGAVAQFNTAVNNMLGEVSAWINESLPDRSAQSVE